jgi:hypothetical protein
MTELKESVVAVPIPPNGFVAITEPFPYKILRVLSTEPSSKFILRLVVRAIEFTEKYHSDTDIQWLVNLLYNHFKQQNNLVYVLIAIDKDEKIVAHSIAYVDAYGDQGYVAHILQIEKDKAVRDKDMEPAKLMIEDWVRMLGIKTILMTTIKQAAAELARSGGFYEYRTIVRKDLG